MTTMIVLNIVISAVGVALVVAGMRFGYLIGGGAFERRGRIAELPVRLRPLDRAA